MDKKELIDNIVKSEWDMFQAVQTVDGIRASCQDDFNTFEIMRSSQFMSWSDAVLESYLEDLESAKNEKRNLITEKYARMMESTSPLEFERIKHLLPPLHPDVLPLIDKILEIIIAWEEELAGEFPRVTRRGRVLYSNNDTSFSTSKSTYFKGELLTYSLRTLRLYHEHLLDLKSKNINGSRIILEETVKRYGYNSLEQANEMLRDSN